MQRIQTAYAVPSESGCLAEVFGRWVFEAASYSDLARICEQRKYNAREFESRILEDSQSVTTAYIDSELVGMCITSFDDFLLWIDWIIVAPNFHRRGIANELIKKVEARAIALGYWKIWCESLVSNTASIQLFKSHGYRQSETFENHWYAQDFCFLEKRLK
jgi:ribosomal protein S18 acetylase RimI-like enzyme